MQVSNSNSNSNFNLTWKFKFSMVNGRDLRNFHDDFRIDGNLFLMVLGNFQTIDMVNRTDFQAL